MILSMTGYGKAESQINDKKLIVEIRSLNSKALDFNMRTAPELRSRELDIRTLVGKAVIRGKVDFSIYYQDQQPTTNSLYTPINKDAFRFYYQQLSTLCQEVGIPANGELLNAICHMPDVTRSQDNGEASDDEWQVVVKGIEQALDGFIAFRTQEGASLERMFREKLEGISQLLAEVEPLEKGRVEKIKQHLMSNLEKLSEDSKQQIDHNRLEQEMIYYLEKLDITEEKVRLRNHIAYFQETMEVGDSNGVGKKLGFIAQEMGREINTLGSKSNQSEMQIIVVKMKDLLEQIKEQVLNVL